MTSPSKTEYCAAFLRLCERQPRSVIEIETAELFIIIGTLQLALRHPQFPAASRQIVTGFINQVTAQIAEEPWRRAIECGFDPQFDE